MAKLTLSDVSNITGQETSAINTINNNSALIETALENTLSRDGTSPNTMSADIDMNGNSIFNASNIDAETLTLDGVVISGAGSLATQGDKGWSPEFAGVADGDRRVFQLVGYVGGEGAEPTDNVNEYVGASGYTAVLASATDFRGAAGAGTGDMLAANNLSDVSNAAASFTYIKQAATDSETGVVEHATQTEALAGTAGNLVITAAVMKAILDIICPVGTVETFLSIPASNWLELNGGTIGNASSGASARANADTEELFSLIWEDTSSSDLPIYSSTGVLSTKGANAAVDFAANKRITLPDLRDKFIRGKGASRNLASAQAESIGPHNHTASIDSAGSHTHVTTMSAAARYGLNPSGSPEPDFGSGDSIRGNTARNMSVSTSGAHTHTVTVNNNSGTENRPANVAFYVCVKY